MKKKLLSYRALDIDLAILLLKMTFGGLFVYYGYMKIDSFATVAPIFPDPIGVGGRLSFFLVIFAEFFCGFLVFIGFLTRLAVIPITITMIVVFFIVHAKDPFNAKQVPFIHLLLCISIFLSGSGKYSVDRWLIRD